MWFSLANEKKILTSVLIIYGIEIDAYALECRLPLPKLFLDALSI